MSQPVDPAQPKHDEPLSDPAADYDPEYVQYVRLFNDGAYGDALRILVEAWQKNPTDTFFKGLIQLAGAFEHWHDDSLFWAEDLFASAHNLLQSHEPVCDGMDVSTLLQCIRECHEQVQQARNGRDNEASGDRADAGHTVPTFTLHVEGVTS